MSELAPTSRLVSTIDRLEAALLQMPQADIRTLHAFYPGRYERTIIIPPWTVLTGAEHKTPYRVRLVRGTIAVNTDEGIKLLTGPSEFQAPAGVKRAGRVLQDEVEWVDIYDNPDNCTDLFTLEERLYVVPACGLGESRRQASIDRDREDYVKFLSHLGISQTVMDSVVATDDLIPMPAGFDVELKASPIHGSGLYATRHFAADEWICPGRIDGHRTPAGRYINHSAHPNTTTVMCGDDIGAVALRDIHPGEEITISYYTSLEVNCGLTLERSS